MNTHDFYYDLPEEYIAQTPAEPRDSSRLLIYDRKTKEVQHKIFRDIYDELHPGDVLVVNNTPCNSRPPHGDKKTDGKRNRVPALK